MSVTGDPSRAWPPSDVFSTADVAAVLHWAALAARYRCFLWQGEEGRIAETDENGREAIAVSYGDPQLEPLRFVSPCGGSWVVEDPMGLLGHYETLYAALQSIQPTTRQGKAE